MKKILVIIVALLLLLPIGTAAQTTQVADDLTVNVTVLAGLQFNIVEPAVTLTSWIAGETGTATGSFSFDISSDIGGIARIYASTTGDAAWETAAGSGGVSIGYIGSNAGMRGGAFALSVEPVSTTSFQWTNATGIAMPATFTAEPCNVEVNKALFGSPGSYAGTIHLLANLQ